VYRSVSDGGQGQIERAAVRAKRANPKSSKRFLIVSSKGMWTIMYCFVETTFQQHQGFSDCPGPSVEVRPRHMGMRNGTGVAPCPTQ